jgi:hypothetical protein
MILWIFHPQSGDRLSTSEQPVDDDERSKTTARLPCLQSGTLADVRRVIMNSPTKSCSLDPLLTFLL